MFVRRFDLGQRSQDKILLEIAHKRLNKQDRKRQMQFVCYFIVSYDGQEKTKFYDAIYQ